MAAETALILGVEIPEIVAAFPHVSPAPGGSRCFRAGQPGRSAGTAGTAGSPPFTVIVDYAHTPAGLDVVLREARGMAGTAGGSWWPSAAAATGIGPSGRRWDAPASLLSDVAVLTSDNPRDEDPLSIIERGAGGRGRRRPAHAVFMVEADRRAAIALVLGGGPGR